MNRRDSFGASKGSILILVFFILVVSSLFSLSVGFMVRQRIQLISRLESRQKLRLIGDAAVQKAISIFLEYKSKKPQCEALSQSWSRNEQEFRKVKVGGGEFTVSYTRNSSEKGQESETWYGLVDEERKINLNLVKSRDILQRFFKECGGLTQEDALALAESILDWRREGDEESMYGAGNQYYKSLSPPYLPRHQDLKTLQELLYIKGMTPELYEKILPYVTLESSGFVNLNTAPRPVLLALGFDPVICSKILAFRGGRDRLEGTEDDLAFKDVSSASQVLASSGYLYDNEQAGLDAALQSGLLVVSSQNFSVQVLARLEHSPRGLRVKAIFGETGVIKCWEEEFVVLPS